MYGERTASFRVPLDRIDRWISRTSRAAITSLGVVLTLAAGALDLLTGPELASLTFYLVPVVLVARAGSRWHGVFVATLAGVVWAGAEAVRGRVYDSAALFLWASFTRLVVFLTITLLVQRAGGSAARHEVTATGAECPYCGSTDTLALHVGLVCRSCRRLSE